MTRDEKFKELYRMFTTAKADKIDEVHIAHPEVFGDTYEELVENLNRMADAEIALRIVPRKVRGK